MFHNDTSKSYLLFPAIVDICIPCCFFVFSVYFKTTILFDLCGCLSSLISVVIAVVQPSGPDSLFDFKQRQLIAFFSSISWSLRLITLNSLRFSKSKSNNCRLAPLKNNVLKLLLMYVGQAIWTFLILLPVYINVSSSTPQHELNGFDWFFLSCWLFGYFIVTISEEQKNHWKRTNQGKFINVGMWTWIRHPNIAGECILWFGSTGFCLTGLTWPYYNALWIPVLMALTTKFYLQTLFEEKAALARYGHLSEYQEYRTKTSLLNILKRLPFLKSKIPPSRHI